MRRGGAAVSVRCGPGGAGAAVGAGGAAVGAAVGRAPPPRAGLTFVRAPPAPRAWYFSTRRRAGAAGPRDGLAPAAALTSPPAPSAGAARPAGKDKRAAAAEPRPPPRQHEQRRDGQVQHLARRGQQQLQLQQQRLQLPLPHQAGCHEEVRGLPRRAAPAGDPAVPSVCRQIRTETRESLRPETGATLRALTPSQVGWFFRGYSVGFSFSL